jgi:hypothetical protein
MIIIILLFFVLIIHRCVYPWHYIDGNGLYNIFGKNKYGENKKQRMNRYISEIRQLEKEINK